MRQLPTKAWSLRCLLCGRDDIECLGREGKNDLVCFQEHAMKLHAVTLPDLQRQTRVDTDWGEKIGTAPVRFVYRLPDGREWLEAIRIVPTQPR